MPDASMLAADEPSDDEDDVATRDAADGVSRTLARADLPIRARPSAAEQRALSAEEAIARAARRRSIASAR